MAVPARTDARGRTALALLIAAVLAGSSLTARPARAAGEPLGPSVPAPADSAVLLAQATESGTAAPAMRVGGRPAASPDGTQALEPGSGFTVRRVANPRFRAPALAGALLARPLGTLVGSQYARARLTRHESGPVSSSTDWEIVAGRDRGARQQLEIWAQGFSSPAYDQIRLLRLSSQHGPLTWSLGDVATQPVGMLPWIQRLRGGLIARTLPRGSDWRLLGGVVPTLTHGVAPNTALATLLFDDLPIQKGALSFGVMGFGRRAPQQGGLAGANPDSLAGGGAAALYAAQIASPYGDVRSTFMAQLHNLDGGLSPAGLQALQWSLDRHTIAATVRDQVGTRNARQTGSERLSQAPSHEASTSAQLRLAGGRAEMHLAALTSSGGDAALAAQTAQVGASGSLGGRGWYSGLDFTWNRRAPLYTDERRIAVQTGRVSERGDAVLVRVERNDDNLGRDQVQFTGDVSASPLPGLRLSLEPRLDWQARRFERGMFSARLGWPLLRSSARMNASLTLTSTRTQGFRSELSEASVSLSFAPRSRDRGMIEARRYEESGVRSLEYTGSYDYLADMYASPPGALAAPNTGTLAVTVVRADSASGVPDALVSLDGKEFRFTDGEGVARFTNTQPGSHVVSVVERSLPTAHRVVGASTVFVTIERGRTPEPLRFEIARPVRRVRF
jgi:hypothetical protein